jgi:hypothetical protein
LAARRAAEPCPLRSRYEKVPLDPSLNFRKVNEQDYMITLGGYRIITPDLSDMGRGLLEETLVQYATRHLGVNEKQLRKENPGPDSRIPSLSKLLYNSAATVAGMPYERTLPIFDDSGDSSYESNDEGSACPDDKRSYVVSRRWYARSATRRRQPSSYTHPDGETLRFGFPVYSDRDSAVYVRKHQEIIAYLDILSKFCDIDRRLTVEVYDLFRRVLRSYDPYWGYLRESKWGDSSDEFNKIKHRILRVLRKNAPF